MCKEIHLHRDMGSKLPSRHCLKALWLRRSKQPALHSPWFFMQTVIIRVWFLTLFSLITIILSPVPPKREKPSFSSYVSYRDAARLKWKPGSKEHNDNLRRTLGKLIIALFSRLWAPMHSPLRIATATWGCQLQKKMIISYTLLRCVWK